MRKLKILKGPIVAALVVGCGATTPAPPPTALNGGGLSGRSVGTLPPGYLPGYLAKGTAPTSLRFIPPPPAPNSAAQMRDDVVANDAVANIGGPRWLQATEDADLSFPKAAGTFSCALGVRVTEVVAPRLYVLLRRTMIDLGLSTYPTKTKYMRPRPFTVNQGAVCTPSARNALAQDGSYPSGHSAVGWGWALILAEAAPARQDMILARGRAFGQSRLACNVHWQSDVEEGRVMGSAIVARLHNDPIFKADLQASEREITLARKKRIKP